MNSKGFRITGWILMILGILIPLSAIFIQIKQYMRNPLALADIFSEGLLFGVILFALVFLPGFKYFRISKEGKSSKLENWAVWLMIVTILLEVILFMLLEATSGDAEGVAFGMFIFGGFLLIPHCVGILLLWTIRLIVSLPSPNCPLENSGNYIVFCPEFSINTFF